MFCGVNDHALRAIFTVTTFCTGVQMCFNEGLGADCYAKKWVNVRMCHPKSANSVKLPITGSYKKPIHVVVEAVLVMCEANLYTYIL